MASLEGVSIYGVLGNFICFIVTCYDNVCALTFMILKLCEENLMAAMISVIRSLSTWLYCEEGCLLWLQKR